MCVCVCVCVCPRLQEPLSILDNCEIQINLQVGQLFKKQ